MNFVVVFSEVLTLVLDLSDMDSKVIVLVCRFRCFSVNDKANGIKMSVHVKRFNVNAA